LNFAKLGHQVSVLTTGGPTVSSESLPFEVLRFPARVAPLNNPISIAPFRYRRLLESADIIHVHNEHSFLTLCTMLFKNRLKGPIVLTTHGQLRLGIRALDSLEKMYSLTVGRFVLKRANHVFVNSRDDRDAIIAHGVPLVRLTEVSNAINIPRLSQHLEDGTRKSVLRELGLPPQDRVVLFVGRLILRKGIPTLLDAFRKCGSVRSDCHLILVGDGPLRGLCDAAKRKVLNGNRIRVLSGVSDEFLFRLYQGADILVLPSISESCPTVILEALFFGCRVIASDIPGIRDHFKGVALLVPPLDSSKLTQAILATLDKGTPSRDETNIIRRMLIEQYSWERITGIYSSVFRTLVAQNAVH